MSETARTLRDDQLEAFDKEYVTDARWRPLAARLDETFAGRPFTFLDVGGGNGRFADKVLAAYPAASGMVLDNAAILLARNAPHPRKQLLCEPVERVGAVLGAARFDVVHLNWVLHHLVRDGYGATRRHIVASLALLRGALRPGGRISVYENLYDGMLLDGLPGRLIYGLTSSGPLAPLTGRLGANTAGVGVCFQSRHQWTRLFEAAGLRVDFFTPLDPLPLRLGYKLALGVGAVRTGHFWLRA